MFYTKINLTEGATLVTEITNDNVFTQCHKCGAEIGVDLADLFKSLGDGLTSAVLYCYECSEKQAGTKHTFDMPITLDGLSWFMALLCNAGYTDQICDLLDDYAVTTLEELESSEYDSFGRALSEMAFGRTER